ncbi:hypothetical protein ASF49_16780 [Methylobacterium sp. Leaf104]|uniref:hypothetical protein n=1 Tax=Methylobacterium TaxID=407 RepID=UPI0006FFFE48|nr:MULTISPECIES: hypothetical protein [Methylobacterium]KQP41430.1 hypothetical protein ASF49_16780 [Methylobacterium sp. Leaf104]MCI9881593.1 hypothetical protein [Methylobacterium goesingense]
MAQLPLDRVEQIGLSAARSVAGPRVRAIKVRVAVDSTDEPAYYLSFLSEPGQAQEAELLLDIAHKVRDGLIASGDESYPYIRLVTPDEWGGP